LDVSPQFFKVPLKTTCPLSFFSNSMSRLPPVTAIGRDRLPRGRPPPLPIPGHDLMTHVPHTGDTFRTSIQAFVADAESHLGSEYAISRLLTRFGFQKRRLYDVLCVLSSVGCCEKRSNDAVHWFGQSRILAIFQKLQLDAGVHLPVPTLDSIIGSNDTVSISPLTIQFALCFLVLQMDTLDIRHISRYLSRRTLRHKSTLCKLYQIAHILEAAGIIRRSDIPSKLTMVARFFTPVAIESEPRPPAAACAYTIESLLNHTPSGVHPVLKARRSDFFAEIARDQEDLEETDST
jgi:hypothetical protein